ncbi:Nucleosome assembly factor involved in chromatin assembly and disassembly [Fasciola hepatica]|uniref:Nucleosome assembly factor involved in chromatin assembly and disassembly n=1 Tax=Fasciola hepatica TaxID=6192 RepID=A0A4E0R3I4_FASHE|nr:Nucleosome assembly factor involved in chromatin assembly and disassembly [Fasciola hepatica]
MAKVNICNVEVLDNPASFFDPFKFQITFECHEPLEDDLEWKLVYVSSAYNASLDQTLDSILVGPVPVGRHQFLFEADAPDPKKIPAEDVVGVTVVLIQALYRNKEFIRVGYYVNNEYKKEELRLEPPSEPILEELERHIIASDPRVTRFPIDWGDGLLDGCPEPEQSEEPDMDEQVLPSNEAVVGGVEEDEEDEDPEEEEEIEEEEEASENVPEEGSTVSSNAVPVNKCDQLILGISGSATSEPLHQVQSTAISMDSS